MNKRNELKPEELTYLNKRNELELEELTYLNETENEVYRIRMIPTLKWNASGTEVASYSNRMNWSSWGTLVPNERSLSYSNDSMSCAYWLRTRRDFRDFSRKSIGHESSNFQRVFEFFGENFRFFFAIFSRFLRARFLLVSFNSLFWGFWKFCLFFRGKCFKRC